MESFATKIDAPTEYVGPVPLPDELLEGWQGRVRMFENLTRPRDVEKLLRIRVKARSLPLRKQSDFVDLAAANLGYSSLDLWRSHTQMPFFSALESNKRQLSERWVHESLQFRRRSFFRTGCEYPRLCVKCVMEDLEFWTYSYWRRSHHLPGVPWCIKHGIPLLQIKDKSAFKQWPHCYADLATPIFTEIDLLIKNPVVMRFVEIATEILQSAPTVSSTIATAVFNRRALAAKLCVTERRRGVTVSQLARRSVPVSWLRPVFPHVFEKTNRYIWGIDRACTGNRPRFTTTTFCLIAALLYDSPDEAAHELYGFNRDVQPRARLLLDQSVRT